MRKAERDLLMSEEERNSTMAERKEMEVREREKRLNELSLKRKKARQVTAKKEAAKFQQNENDRIKHKDAEDARIRNEDAIALTQERTLEEKGSSANAKRIMKIGRRAISAKGMYLGGKCQFILYITS